jgi:cysteinyl-tRNA synthetase
MKETKKMTIKFYNTLSRKKEEFKPVNENEVKMYNCGPTVYSDPHIGNLRAFLFADLIRRTLELEGYKVKQVMNITDVGHLTGDDDETGEDKIEKQARKEKLDPWKLTEKYANLFFEDLDKVKIKKAFAYPKATDHVKEMIEITKELIKKGYAYEAGGNVYFDISKFEEYSKLSKIKLEELRQGERAVKDPNKRSQFDFALWFSNSKHTNHIMQWESPWGTGYPGWHIECSAMSMKYLSSVFDQEKPDFNKFETIDIHTGGEDNIFPHHESEIAQTKCATGKDFSNFWMHTRHLIINGEKMGKSLGNFYTLEDLQKKGYSFEAIRFAMLSTHYRQQMNLTFKSIDAAKQNIDRIQELIYKLLDIKEDDVSIFQDLINDYRDQFRDALCDDLNVSEALGITNKFITEINKLLAEDKLSAVDAGFALNYFSDFNKIFDVLKFEKDIIPEKVLNLAELRKDAKSKKDYAVADNLRDQIKELGYIVKDSKDGSYSISKE